GEEGPGRAIELDRANLRKHLTIDRSRNAGRSRSLDREAGSLLLRQLFEVIHSAVGDALAPVDQLGLGVARHLHEHETAVVVGRLPLHLKVMRTMKRGIGFPVAASTTRPLITLGDFMVTTTSLSPSRGSSVAGISE